jgi:chromosome partitioning protein
MVIAIANQKGGTGKTTSAVNLAGAFVATGRRVLLLDCDPQANATVSLGLDYNEVPHTLADVLAGLPIAEAVLNVQNVRAAQSTLDAQGAPNHQNVNGVLHLIPSHVAALSNAERNINAERGDQFRLRDALADARDCYDYTFLDCPPSLSGLTISCLIAAQHLLIPVPCEFLPIEGVGQLFETVDQIRRYFNPTLSVVGILPVRYDRRLVSAQVVLGMLEHFGVPVLQTRIRATVRITEAQGAQEPISVYDPDGYGAQDYAAAATEIEAMLCATT